MCVISPFLSQTISQVSDLVTWPPRTSETYNFCLSPPLRNWNWNWVLVTDFKDFCQVRHQDHWQSFSLGGRRVFLVTFLQTKGWEAPLFGNNFENNWKKNHQNNLQALAESFLVIFNCRVKIIWNLWDIYANLIIDFLKILIDLYFCFNTQCIAL